MSSPVREGHRGGDDSAASQSHGPSSDPCAVGFSASELLTLESRSLFDVGRVPCTTGC